MKIKDIYAREILDSRGDPTIETTVVLENKTAATSSVPSGVSRGKYEALELRDGDPNRYHGKGVLRAITNINTLIKPKILGMEAKNQLEIDKTLINLDGSENKSKLGANAILSVSQAACKAAALEKNISLFVYISHLYGLEPQKMKIPIPIFNLIEGGKHGAGDLDFQEFHVIPSGQKTYAENLRAGQEIYQAVKKTLIRRGEIHSVGDEGGFAPNLSANLDALEVLASAIQETSYVLKRDVFLGLDVAAGCFYQNEEYKAKDKTIPCNSEGLINFYQKLLTQYPLLNLEDPFWENDWESWQKITESFPQVLIVGDDLLATNKKRAQQAIEKRACSAILVKPNQIGTITEAIEVIKTARQANWKIIVSHRGGETNDDFIADFAVGVRADYVKFGAPARGERIAKYNRLLKIEEAGRWQS